jgi:nitronate monooxygenase
MSIRPIKRLIKSKPTISLSRPWKALVRICAVPSVSKHKRLRSVPAQKRYVLTERSVTISGANRAPCDDKLCDLVIAFHPEVVSFHFGLPNNNLLARVRTSGAKIISSATSVDEARWLEDQGCYAIIAQGYEAGGHRGMFLTNDVSTQVGTMAPASQVVDAAKVPVPLENLEMSERTGIILLSFSSPMLIPLTALFATLSSVFRSRSALQLENLALHHQIGVLQRTARKRPKLTPADRLLWVWLSRIWSGWRSALAIVTNLPCLASRQLSPVLDLEGAAWPTGTTRRFSRGSRSSSQHVS